MNTIATSTSTKRVVLSVLIAMLGITAALSGPNSILNANHLLALVWPMSLILVTSYWLRTYLTEHIDLAEDIDVHFQPHITGIGFHMTPVCMTRT
jgi:hypothetical protein